MPSINFKGKSIVHSYHLTVPYRQVIPDETLSVLTPGQPASLKGNLILHGDNLHALKSLIPSFAGKIKCIYIDPPYNTGNENWVYNDNVAHPMLQEWLKQVVDKEDLTRHDKWLCMMWPRLQLLRELLSDDGVIFVSIDDHEVSSLRQIMDEIFGENYFITQFVWKSRQNKDNRNLTGVSVDHEYVLCYGKAIRGGSRKVEQFSNPDNDPRGPWISGNMVGLATEESRPNLHYELTNPETGINYEKPALGWRYDRKRMTRLIKENQIIWPSSPHGRPRVKVFLSEMQQEFTGFSSIIGIDVFTRTGTAEIDAIFGERKFDFPKPSALLQELIRQGCPQDGIILDSFAGSGTTAHAVLALNAEDGGNRRFILVEQEDYADTLTAERVRRVIKGVPRAKDTTLQAGLGGSFTYCTLGPNFDEDELLRGGLPAYQEMARFVFFTATGEQLDEAQIDEENCYLGESARYSVYLIYKPDVEYLKHTPLDLKFAMNLTVSEGKLRLVIASHKYLDEHRMAEYDIEFCQLPFGIYRYRAD